MIGKTLFIIIFRVLSATDNNDNNKLSKYGIKKNLSYIAGILEVGRVG